MASTISDTGDIWSKYYPGQKKEPSSRFAARRTLFRGWYHASSGAISAGQKSRTVADRTCPALIEHDITRGTAFFSPWISIVVLFFVQGSSSKHNATKNTTRVRGPFLQSITAILTEEKREAVTNPTHVAVYLFRDQDRDRSRRWWWQWVPGPVQKVKKSSKREMTLTVEYSEMTAKMLNISK